MSSAALPLYESIVFVIVIKRLQEINNRGLNLLLFRVIDYILCYADRQGIFQPVADRKFRIIIRIRIFYVVGVEHCDATFFGPWPLYIKIDRMTPWQGLDPIEHLGQLLNRWCWHFSSSVFLLPSFPYHPVHSDGASFERLQGRGVVHVELIARHLLDLDDDAM
jgi:hypothetical protein